MTLKIGPDGRHPAPEHGHQIIQTKPPHGWRLIAVTRPHDLEKILLVRRPMGEGYRIARRFQVHLQVRQGQTAQRIKRPKPGSVDHKRAALPGKPPGVWRCKAVINQRTAHMSTHPVAGDPKPALGALNMRRCTALILIGCAGLSRPQQLG